MTVRSDSVKGNDKKIHNKNCGNAYEDIKQRQKNKWNQIQTHQCR